MKKINFKSFTAGLICGGMVMGLCAPAFAAQTVKSLEAYYKDIKIRINGAIIVPKDVTGAVVEPFIVDGTTYLPVRALAEALGCDVAWDTATDTVLVETSATIGRSVFLDSLAQTTASSAGAFRAWSMESDFDAAGQQYNHSLVALVDGGVTAGTITQSVQYELARGYSTLTGKVSPIRGLSAISGSTHQINIYGDGALLYSSPVFSSSLAGSVDAFNVDVSSVGVLKVEMVTLRTTLASYATGLGFIQPMLSSK